MSKITNDNLTRSGTGGSL